MNKFNTGFALVIIILLHCCFAPRLGAGPTITRRPKVLIFVYDAGETLGLLPVAPLLTRRKIDVRWAPLTPWTVRILEEKHEAFLRPPDALETMPHVTEREAEISVEFWLDLVAREKPDLVILGLVSRAQEQLAQELKARGIRTAGFYDGFDPTTGDSVVARVARQVDTVWAPTATIARNLSELGVKPVKVLGQPSVETWYRTAGTVKPADLYARLGIPRDKKILLFAGQYGDGYSDILDAFLTAAVIELENREDLFLVLSPHPKTNGELERQAVIEHPHPRISVLPTGISTAELATVSKAVITWRSTVGTQAAFLGKPIIYFNFDRADYTNDLIQHGLAAASTPATFGRELTLALGRRTSATKIRRKLARLGYIVDADQKIAAEVVRLVRGR